MSVFPLAAPVNVQLDGVPVSAYVQAYEQRGRIFAPVRPYVTDVADRIWYEGSTLVIQRDGRTARVRLGRSIGGLDRAYVPIASVLRALGERVRYDAGRRQVDISSPSSFEVLPPRPFDARAPQAPPQTLFTPMPIATPRPLWSGPPQPRRTPLPLEINASQSPRGPGNQGRVPYPHATDAPSHR